MSSSSTSLETLSRHPIGFEGHRDSSYMGRGAKTGHMRDVEIVVDLEQPWDVGGRGGNGDQEDVGRLWIDDCDVGNGR
jgi:hypothetical protein